MQSRKNAHLWCKTIFLRLPYMFYILHFSLGPERDIQIENNFQYPISPSGILNGLAIPAYQGASVELHNGAPERVAAAGEDVAKADHQGRRIKYL